MKKILEKKILKRVYRYESRHTFADAVFQMLFIALAGFMVLLFGYLLISALQEQETIGFMSIILNEWEIVRTYWQDLLQVIISELPKDLTVWLLMSLTGFVVVLILVARHAHILIRKMRAIKRYKKRSK